MEEIYSFISEQGQPPHLFTGGKVEGEQGAAIHVDVISGTAVQTGTESSLKLDVVVLEGDFNEEADEDWTKQQFESYQAKASECCFHTLACIIVYLQCTRNIIHQHCMIKCGDRAELHKKLFKAQIVTVEDFLRLLVRDSKKLRNASDSVFHSRQSSYSLIFTSTFFDFLIYILVSGMSNRMWENTVEHAKTCVLGGKHYVYYTDQTHSPGVVFGHIYKLRGLMLMTFGIASPQSKG
ncbi:hypothetical protein F3Y22_tig00111495pilonHSYRG00041 [Hibiscus syriacus]|uniref:Uncharacterized protein n=1 Tax=Hibiscus syriacus TaxID=106335 RepID=A0A6A2Y2N4_HIBSY|nr:hypothetical protein F3Y22_tig00111495pilonHSYRG00041 [Hibiscus syriacus]